jgi:hypothetical protein
MSNVPEGAQRSEDGYWWWDGQQWQPTEEGVAAGAADNAAGGDERVAARLSHGYPASGDHLTDEQKTKLLAEPTVAVEAVVHDEVQVVAMEDAGHENGATA